MNTDLSYQVIEETVLANDMFMGAAETHGVLAGMLCVNSRVNYEQWLSALFEQPEKWQSLPGKDRALLAALFEETRRVLDEENFEFDLLLPDDEADLSERACALSNWCKGYLYGLGCGERRISWSEECNEILRDMQEISRLDTQVEGEEEEQAYAELIEYVRIGVQLVRSEIQRASQERARLH